jgi:hypothetical protein
MSTATLSVEEQSVLDHIASEIDSIRVDDTSSDVAYKPDAVTREGWVD